MRRYNNTTYLYRICLLLAALCITAAGTGLSYAYFTSYTKAEGSRTVYVGATDIIPDEQVQNLLKFVTLTNNGTSECYGRIRVLCPEEYRISVQDGQAWGDMECIQNGEYLIEYRPVIAAHGGKSTTLIIGIHPSTNVRDDFNVIVIEECVPVLYTTEDGRQIQNPPDWNYRMLEEDIL